MLEPHKLDRLLAVLEHRLGHALLTAVEDAKIALTSTPGTTLDLSRLAGIAPLDITRDAFEHVVAEQIERIVTTVRATLSAGQVRADAIGTVFLTGGSSRVPVLLQALRTTFSRARILEGDAFGSVATGLALDAHTRFADLG